MHCYYYYSTDSFIRFGLSQRRTLAPKRGGIVMDGWIVQHEKKLVASSDIISEVSAHSP